MTLEEAIQDCERATEYYQTKAAAATGTDLFQFWREKYEKLVQYTNLFKELKALKEKPLRRIDTMSEEELAIAVNGFKASLDGCQFCPVETCRDANGECSVKFAHYLLSPITAELGTIFVDENGKPIEPKKECDTCAHDTDGDFADPACDKCKNHSNWEERK